MSKEIGSEFWINKIPNGFYSSVPEWISKFGNPVLTSSGRGAISLLLKEVKPRFKTVLLPFYICDSVILPFLEQGYTCYFYDLNIELISNIESILEFGDIGIFLHMGYYGFPTNNNLKEIVKLLKYKEVIIVEDVTHTLFSDFERFKENDYYIASLRKWFALPSGGFLASVENEIKCVLRYNESVANIRKQALIAKANYIISTNQELKKQFLELFSKGEILLNEDLEPYSIDKLSKTIINTIDTTRMIQKRRDNFIILSEGLKELKLVKSVFSELPDDVCPMFYPITIKSYRDKIREYLTKKTIYCPIHWSRPNHIKYNCDKNGVQIYNTILSIPCDQRYDGEDMMRIILELLRYTEISS